MYKCYETNLQNTHSLDVLEQKLKWQMSHMSNEITRKMTTD